MPQSTLLPLKCFVVWFGILATSLNLSNHVQAQQVVPDGTLDTIVTQAGNTFTITNGTTAGTNLFHSLREFSIPTGGAAIFDNATTIQNIFSRVTGSNVSNIDGLIQTNGTANLFLLNPNGILFGANAQLNVGGSFIGTTAERIKFADNSEFGVTNVANPLLTISAPIGLQMGQNAASIQVQGTGHSHLYTRSTALPFDRSSHDRGLAVPTGQTLALIGSNILLESGVLTAEDGQIQVGAIGANQLVDLNATPLGWQFGYNRVSNFGNIQLNERSLLDASGLIGGSIQLQGQQIDLLNASTLLIQNFGSISAGSLQVNATEGLRLQGNSAAGLAISELLTVSLGSGRGAEIQVNAPKIQMYDGSVIGTRAFNLGSGGAIQVRADQLEIIGASLGNPALVTTLGSATFGVIGTGGDVAISTRQLAIQNGGALTTITFGNGGNGGNVTIDAKESVIVSGRSPILLSPSTISIISLGSGDAGRLKMNTSEVSILNGGQITSSTFASGAAGNITITADRSVKVADGFSIGPVLLPSQITSASDFTSPEIQQAFGLPAAPTGRSGNVVINTPILQVANGSLISVANNSAQGDGGSLSVNANSISLDRNARLSASTVSGEGGNVQVKTNLVSLRRGSSITTTAGGTGKGGDITIDAPILLGLENSDIVANATRGQGGNIAITTQAILGLAYRDLIDPESVLTSDITASSQFDVNGTVQISNIGVDPNTGLVSLPTTLVDASQQISADCSTTQNSSFVMTGRGGIPQNPLEYTRVHRNWSDLRVAQRSQHQAQSTVSTAPLIEAATWQHNAQTGGVELIAGQTVQSNQIAICDR
jgi:filamentous hemagglutinin family protein